MTEAGSTDRAIGRLEGQVASLKDQMAELVRAVESSRVESSSGRARIYGELEAIREDASESRRKMDKLAEADASASETIKFVNRWKERFIGMNILLVAISSTIGAGVALAWKWIIVKLGLG